MFYVYILQSKKDAGYYIGYSRDLRRRFDEHTNGNVTATKHRRPLYLVYYEAYSTEAQAREREEKLKHFGSAYHALLKRLGHK